MTQKDIARMLRLSPATVSMALRGQGRISAPVREKILALSRKHHITIRKTHSSAPVRPRAPALRIGYCSVHYVGNWLHADTFRGMVEQSPGRRHEILLYSSTLPHGASDEKAAWEIREQVLSARLDGLVLDPNPALVDALRDAPLPKVLIGYFNFHPDSLDAVVPDNLWAGYRLTRELIGQGHRRIACVRCMKEQWNSREKFAGYRTALEEAGLSVAGELVFSGDFTWMSGAHCAQELLGLPDPPPAIFLENDWVTGQFVQGLKEAGEKGVRLLESATLAHVEDARRETGLSRDLARMELPADLMGRIGIRLVMDRISGKAADGPITIKVAPVFRPAGPRRADRNLYP